MLLWHLDQNECYQGKGEEGSNSFFFPGVSSFSLSSCLTAQKVVARMCFGFDFFKEKRYAEGEKKNLKH